MRARVRSAVLLAVLGWSASLSAAPTPTAPTDSDAAAQAGQQLYRTGRNRWGGELQGQVGSGVTLSGQMAACARCHGNDGAGGREAGLTAPPLRWSALTQARVGQLGMTDRAGYDTARLLDAIRQGVDANGRPLASAMPRFELQPREVADLIAHLQRLGTEQDREPGVHPDRIVLASVLPLTGVRAAQGHAARAALAACVARGNRSGGLYGRRIELQVHDAADPAGDTAIAARLQTEAVAVIAPWWRDKSARDIATLLPGLPVLGPLGAASELEPGGGDVYAVAPQLSEQVRVLIDAYARGELNPAPLPVRSRPARLLLMASQEPQHRSASLAAQRQALLYGALDVRLWPGASPLQPSSPGALSAALAWLAQQDLQPQDAVLVLGPSTWLRTTAETLARDAQDGSAPLLLASDGQAGRDLLDAPAALWARTVFSHSLPAAQDLDPRPLQQDLQQVNARLDAPALQSLAYAASCLGVEALRRSGRLVTRDRLRLSLEALHDFRTGVLPPISYVQGQRLGVTGAALVRLSPPSSGQPAGLRPVLPWRLPQPW